MFNFFKKEQNLSIHNLILVFNIFCQKFNQVDILTVKKVLKKKISMRNFIEEEEVIYSYTLDTMEHFFGI